jgi:uncharacterized membrane protein
MPKDNRAQAIADFRRIVMWIIGAAIVMVIGALTYLAATGDLTKHMVIATVVGTFFSVALGGGLFAVAFFSDKSGHDQSVSDATSNREDA